ncbi:MAG: peroxiredoxin [Pseudomonadota bacterium]
MSCLVSRKAPDFTAPAVLGSGEIVSSFNLAKATEGKYGLLFFYPLDFTFVCPTELIALEHRMKEFHAHNVEVIAVSIDSHFTHNAWRNTAIDKGGIGPVSFTMVADINHQITQAYGVEHPGLGAAFRSSFIIDDHGVVRIQQVNDLPIGRNIDELLRLVDALQHNAKHGEVCPSNWKKGQAAMKANPAGVAAYLKDNHEGL